MTYSTRSIRRVYVCASILAAASVSTVALLIGAAS
jgi:hypothetical protein